MRHGIGGRRERQEAEDALAAAAKERAEYEEAQREMLREKEEWEEAQRKAERERREAEEARRYPCNAASLTLTFCLCMHKHL